MRLRPNIVQFFLLVGVNALVGGMVGQEQDRFGRKPVLLAGWVVAIPGPLLLIWAPTWGWVVAANALLGINQGLTWSTTVVTKIDLVGPRQRGLAMGLNEAAGYGAVAVTAWLAGYLAAHHGLRPSTGSVCSSRPIRRCGGLRRSSPGRCRTAGAESI